MQEFQKQINSRFEEEKEVMMFKAIDTDEVIGQWYEGMYMLQGL